MKGKLTGLLIFFILVVRVFEKRATDFYVIQVTLDFVEVCRRSSNFVNKWAIIYLY